MAHPYRHPHLRFAHGTQRQTGDGPYGLGGTEGGAYRNHQGVALPRIARPEPTGLFSPVIALGLCIVLDLFDYRRCTAHCLVEPNLIARASGLGRLLCVVLKLACPAEKLVNHCPISSYEPNAARITVADES